MNPYQNLAGRLLIFVVVWGVSARPAPAGAKLLAEFTVAKGGDPIVLPVTMQGKTYPFLLDTGANRTTFHKSLEPLLGEPKETFETETPDGKTHEMCVYYAPDATVGPLSLRSAGPVYAVDLTELRSVTGLDLDGVLGCAFLRRYAVQLDFDAGRVRFYQAAGPEPAWGPSVPLNMLPGGVPFVVATFGKLQTVMLVDSGYGDTGTLAQKLFDHLREEKRLQVAAIKLLIQDGKEQESFVARIDDLHLGEQDYKNLIFDRGQTVSMLGLEFLSRHVVTLDFPNGKLYLRLGQGFAKTDQNDMSGLHLLRRSDGIEVHSVDAGSSAERAGLRAGDVLRKINGRAVETYRLTQIRRLLRSGDGTSVHVVFRRGQQNYQASFLLKKRV